MTITKKQLLKSYNRMRLKAIALSMACLLLGVMAVSGGVAMAANGFSWSDVEAQVSEMLFEQASEPVEQTLGAISNARYIGKEVCSSNYCTTTVTVDFIDASTTIAAIVNPYRMTTSSNGTSQVVVETIRTGVGLAAPTSTLTLLSVNITGASTTTINQIYCASSQNEFASSTGSVDILTSNSVPTSTTGIIENNLSAANSGGGIGDSLTVAKMMITPDVPYVLCKVGGNMTGGVLGNNNAFDGTVTAVFKRKL